MSIFWLSLVLLASSIPMLAFGVDSAETEEKSLKASDLVEEVNSFSRSSHYFDWRRASFELELGYDYVDEHNNFDCDGGHIGISVPSLSGFSFRTGMRRMVVYGTHSSRQIARTPFRQPGLGTRYEIYAGGSYALLEGRGFTRLTPMIPDLSYVIQAQANVQYHHPNEPWIPRRKEYPDALPGQRVLRPKWVIELGLRWQVYFPETVGVFFETQYMRPLKAIEGYSHWVHYSSGLSFVIGYQ